MIKFLSTLLVSIFMLLFFNSQVVLADDIDLNEGEAVFSANCAACHANGKNLVIPEKTLEIEILSKNEISTVEAITKQVSGGKNAMPAFLDRLSETEINNVANYVLSQAKGHNW
uniref:Cytochrome c-553 n=1 Tax=Kuetzingia canaliculata TaxID=228262 RepID=A0A1Z1MNY9_KUECA|nr:cytochrome c553 [Kuetzingia canaliculata]ARW67778.1 cytochrome c553 [Kuetzingia canaliculata]